MSSPRAGDRVEVRASLGGRVLYQGTVEGTKGGKLLVLPEGRVKARAVAPSVVRVIEAADPLVGEQRAPARRDAIPPPPTNAKAPVRAPRRIVSAAPVELRPVPKPKGPFRSREYLDFVRAHPCMVPRCGAPAPSEPHHWASERGIAQKVDDTRVVPLCRAHHDYLHTKGELPNLDVLATRLWILDRQVTLLTEYLRQRSEVERDRRVG